jgi:hypothetical protein
METALEPEKQPWAYSWKEFDHMDMGDLSETA